jgi:conjugative transposon TraM protein
MTPTNPVSVQQVKMVRMAAYPVIFCIIGFVGFQLGIIGKTEAKELDKKSNIEGIPSAKVKGFDENKYNNALDEANSISKGEGIIDTTNPSIIGSNENLNETQKRQLIGDGYSVNTKTKEQILSEHSQRTNQLLTIQNQAIQDMYKTAPKSTNQQTEERNISNARNLNNYAIELSRQKESLSQNYVQQGVNAPPLTKNEEILKEEIVPEIITTITDIGRENVVSSLNTKVEIKPNSVKNAFFGLKGERKETGKQKNVNNIEAVVHGDADVVAVVNGSNIKLRVLQPFQANGLSIPKNTLITGTCAINGDRVFIGVSNIRVDNQIIELRLKATDLDGLDGLYVPDLNVKNQIRQSIFKTSDAIAAPSFMMTPSNASAGQQIVGQIAAQGTSTVINGVKHLVNQKSQIVKVSIKANHHLLLIPVENR